MEKLEIMNSLKDILNIRCDKFSDKTIFLEKDGINKEYQKVSYLKVKDDTNALGTVMINKLGLKDKRVAVIGENSSKWYETYLAVVCGVGIIVPLDKELPANEILNLVKRSDTKCIVYSTRKKEIVESIREELPKDMIYIEMNKEKSDDISYSFNMLLSEGKQMILNGDTSYIDTKIDREEFRILLFTSGTTAAPKGVMLNHKNICTNAYSAVKLLPQVGNYTTFSVLPMHHTYEFTTDYIAVTSVGGTIGICEGLKYIAKNLKEIKPHCIFAVPALVENLDAKIFKMIKESGKENIVNLIAKTTNYLGKIGIDLKTRIFRQIYDNLGGNLKYIFCGAAPLDKDTIDRMEGYGFVFFQGYGTTEASPLIAATDLHNRVSGTVGKSVEGVEVRIDLSDNEDENSNVGEIIVKGDNVMMGYYENEEETKKVLRKGWLYTGDMGYFDLHGNLVISGRIKNVIVTSNGKNIYPEELEIIINKIPFVSESIVYGLTDPKDKNELIVTARVTLNEKYIEETYGTSRPSNEKLHEIIWEEIKKINKTVVPYKMIKKLEIKDGEFTKTTTMKIKRFVEISK